jgi:hypothetical protein
MISKRLKAAQIEKCYAVKLADVWCEIGKSYVLAAHLEFKMLLFTTLKF